jgi:flagellar biosynthesis protein
MSNDKHKKEQEHLTAALKYDVLKDDAPYVVGLGKGHVAETMLDMAKQHDIPVVQDAELAKALMHLQLWEDIPQELYQIVAEIMVFVANLDNSAKGKLRRESISRAASEES